MSRMLRAAMTETKNAYEAMPDSVESLEGLSPHLEALRAANVDHHVTLIAEAAKRQVQVLCMGELFAGPYFALQTNPMWLALAEDATEGPTVTTLRSAAKAHGMIVVAPIFEACKVSQKRFNTAVVIDESGEILGKYRKTHIPVGKNEQGAFHETFYYDRSDGNLGPQRHNLSKNPYFPVWQTSVCKLGVAICYDRHFQGVMTALAGEGAELVVSPAVTFGEKSRRMWDIEFAVDAARHRLFIGGSNRRGAEPPFTQEYFGASHFVGPSGRLSCASDHENLVISDMDLDELSGPDPSGWDLARDLRPDIYGR